MYWTDDSLECAYQTQKITNTCRRFDVFDLICESSDWRCKHMKWLPLILSRFFFHSCSAPWWRRRSSCVRLLLFEKREQKWMKVFFWRRKKIPAKNGFSATMRNGMRKMVGMFVFFMRFLKPLMKICTWIPWMSLTFYENFAFDFFFKKISFF